MFSVKFAVDSVSLMKKSVKHIIACLIIVVAAIGSSVRAADPVVRFYDSLVSVMGTLPYDTSRLNLLERISVGHYNVDSTAKYAQLELDLARKLHVAKCQSNALRYLGWVAYYNNDYVSSLRYCLDALVIADSIGDKQSMALCYTHLGSTYSMMLNATKANESYFKAYDIYVELNDTILITEVLRDLGHNEAELEMYDEAESMFKKALEIDAKSKRTPVTCEDYYGLATVAYQKYLRYLYVNPQDSLLDVAKRQYMKAYEIASKYSVYQNIYPSCEYLASTMLYQLSARKYSPQRLRN